ncbi:MAG: hypothetical protein CBD31_01810 [Flavobacteriaceae bacterium TMED171]|nr:MAG: hypothetical protein CBD31_01810 [Flavobacteriaceae bacterium TMED171]
MLGRIDELENKEPEVIEKEIEKIVEVENTDGIDALNKDVIKLQAEVASRDQAIERISQKYDLVDKQARKVIDESRGANATFGEGLPPNPEKGQLHTLTGVYPHELKKWNGNKWIDVDKDGTTAYLTTDYIKHLVDSLARNDTDVDELSIEEKEAVSKYLTRKDVLGQ